MTQNFDLAQLVQDIAKDQHELRRYVERLSRSQDAGRTTIHRGAMLFKGDDGEVSHRLGKDGLQPVVGPKPWPPAPAEVEAGENSATIVTDGADVHGASAPDDWRRTLVFMSLDPDFVPTAGDFKASIWDVAGEVVVRAAAGTWWVRLVWETTSKQLSDPSEAVPVDITPPVDAQDIEDTLAEAEQIIADAVAEAQTQLDELRDRLDNFEGFDPTDLIAQINQVTEDLAAARQEAATMVSDLADQVDGIKIPDVSGFITQAEVDAAAAAAETAAKEHADLVAQGAKDDAIAEAEAKANAAREAAEQAAKAYTDQQDIETLEAAAADATAKADAAQSAAEAEADRLAKAEAQAAQTEAIRVAAADALAQAEAARDAAIESASTDATAKAEAAQAAAEAYAEAEAQAKADAAQAEAIRQAAEDATAKANKAREDAEAAANEYADRQDAQVKIDAAQDAQEKADAAQAEAERLAAEHAELVSTGAKDDAIAEAERLHALAVAEAEAAKTRADEAHTEAGAAWDHAEAALNRAISAEDNAKEHADNLPKMLGGTGGPVGTAPNGSVWFRRDSNNTVIGRWERIGGSWVQQEVSGQLIDNLEAGKITALNTEFAESVIGKLWAQLAIVDRLVATSAWIGGAMIGNDAVEAKHVVASETLSGKIAEFLKLSVADLVATGAQVDDAVINKLWVDGLVGLSATLARATIAAQNLYDDPNLERSDQYGSWEVVDGGVEKNGTGSLSGTYAYDLLIPAEPGEEFVVTADVTFLEGSTGDTQIRARSQDVNGAYIGSSTIGAGTISETGQYRGEFYAVDGATHVYIGFWTESNMPSSTRVRWENIKVQKRLDGNLIVEDTIRTRHLHVTREMVGEFAKFMHLVVDQMDVNSLWADTAWLTAVEAASVRLRSVVDDWQTILSGRGMEVISPEGQPTVQLGNYEETGLTLYQDGEAKASLTDDGHVSGAIVSANEEFYYQGTEISELIDHDPFPRGIVGHYMRDLSGWDERDVMERGFMEINFPVYPGRAYMVASSPITVHSPGQRRVLMRFRHRDNQSATLDSRLLSEAASENAHERVTQLQNSTIFTTHPGTEEVTKYVLVSLYSDQRWMISNPSPLGELHLYAIDLGPRVVGSGYDRNISKGRFDSGSDPTPTPPPAPSPKVRRVKTYTMNWWRTWWESGLIPPSGVGYKEVVQGRTPYFTSAGRFRGMVGFPSMTSDLSGADIEKIEVRVRVIHTHSGSGGRVRLGLHGNTSRPSSFTGHSNLQLTNTHFGRGQEKWVTLPSSVYNGFRSGTHRGVVLYSSSTSSSYYVQASPSRFAIRVTYRK